MLSCIFITLISSKYKPWAGFVKPNNHMEKRPIVINIDKLIGHVIILGNDVNAQDVAGKVAGALLKAADDVAEIVKNSNQETE